MAAPCPWWVPGGGRAGGRASGTDVCAPEGPEPEPERVFPSQGGVGLGEGCARVPRCGAGNGCLQVTARPLGPRVPGTASQNPLEAGRLLPALRELPPLLKEY